MNQANTKFSFTIRKQKNLSLILLQGHLSIRDNQILETCINEVKGSDSTFFVISFKDVTTIERNTHRFILTLKNFVIKSDRRCRFKVIGMKEQYRNELIDFGILKQADFTKSLAQVLDEYNMFEAEAVAK